MAAQLKSLYALPVFVAVLLCVPMVSSVGASPIGLTSVIALDDGDRTDDDERRDRIREVRIQSRRDKEGASEAERRRINREERRQIDEINREYGRDNPDTDTDDDDIPGRAGDARLNGFWSSAPYDLGEVVTLTFHWAQLPTWEIIDGPEIGSVFYDVNLDPEEDPLGFVPIGTSTDAASNFALPFTIVDFEPFIRATPFDLSGAPIVITAFDGDNAAIGYVTNVGPVPEPASLLLVGMGLSALAAVARSQRKRAGAKPFHE